MDTKYIHNIYSHSPFPCAHSPSIDTYPQKKPVFPLCSSFLFIECILIVQEGFTLVLQVCIYCALIKSSPSPCYLLILSHYAPIIVNSLLYRTLYYIHIWMAYFNIFYSLFSNIFFLSPTSCSPLR
jgi:hypothetical protein